MSNKSVNKVRKYEFEYGFDPIATCTFEVDRKVFTEEMAYATLNFFSWKYDKEADPIDEVVRKYALQAIRLATINDHNTYGVTRDFKDLEGFGAVDGSIGIKLLDVSGIEIEDSELELQL